MCIADAKKTMSARLEAIERGERRVNFKLRDWIFSRQGAWGEPIPIIYFNGEVQPDSDEQLPVQFPDSEGQLRRSLGRCSGLKIIGYKLSYLTFLIRTTL